MHRDTREHAGEPTLADLQTKLDGVRREVRNLTVMGMDPKQPPDQAALIKELECSARAETRLRSMALANAKSKLRSHGRRKHDNPENPRLVEFNQKFGVISLAKRKHRHDGGGEQGNILLQCIPSSHERCNNECPLSGVKRTCLFAEVRFRGRYWRQSGNAILHCERLLLTQSGDPEPR